VQPRKLDPKRVLEYFRSEDIELADLVLQACRNVVGNRQRAEDDAIIAEHEAQVQPKVPKVKVAKVKRVRRTKAQLAADKAVVNEAV